MCKRGFSISEFFKHGYNERKYQGKSPSNILTSQITAQYIICNKVLFQYRSLGRFHITPLYKHRNSEEVYK